MTIALADVSQRRDNLLRFAVVGGGIAGLATAWSLQTAGHSVVLFERRAAPDVAKCREAVRSTPTMSQILHDWGLADALARISTPILQMIFLDGKSGEELGLVAINGKVMDSLPAEFCCVEYGTMFSLFYDLARDAGVELHFETEIIAVDPWPASVTSKDGRMWSADVVVGADGTESIVRPVVLGCSHPPSDSDDLFTVNLVVPADVARQDEELAALLDSKNWTGWLADNCSMHGILTGPGSDRDYFMVMNITVNDHDVLDEFPMSLESLRFDLFEPRVQKLLKMSKQISKVVFTHYEPFESWVHESGKVVLIGEAAHPMIPSGSHNISTGIEDAATLSILFALPAMRFHTPMLLNVYEELRQPRCASVQRYLRRKREIITIPHGPAQRRRDALLRNQLACHQEDELDDEFLCATYTGFVRVFGFDAREVVQDWWVKWGKSVLIRSQTTEGEDEDDEDDEDAQISVPVVVDAEVEREGPNYPIISDPLMGEDDDILREAAEHRRNSACSVHFLRLGYPS